MRGVEEPAPVLCSGPGVWTSSAQHIQISLKGVQSVWQRCCSSLLSWKSKTCGQETWGVVLVMLLGVCRQFWGKHLWLVCVWSVEGHRVRGAVGSSCANFGCSAPCWAVQRSLEASLHLCWTLGKDLYPQVLHFTQLGWNEGFPNSSDRNFWVVSNLSYSVLKQQGNQKLRILVVVLGNTQQNRLWNLTLDPKKWGKATCYTGRWW